MACCGGAACGDHAQFPAFAPGTSEMSVGLWPFCILLFIIAPTTHVCSYFQFLCVLLLQMFVQVQVQALVKVPGPSLSHLYVPLEGHGLSFLLDV